MSASSKKKLRNEQEAAKMTERQLAEQKEAKKLNLMTRLFVVVLAVIVVAAAWAGITQFISNSGIREKNTVAMTVGEHEISNAELNYYYIDAVNTFYSNYGSYASLFGLDVTTPLDEQVVNEETGATWADDFLNSAKESLTSMYALYDEAIAAGHTLTEEELASIDTVISNMAAYAMIYGYEDAEGYLKAIYGNGATEESYRAYYELNLLAESYYSAYSTGLTYDDAAIREADNADPQAYNAYSYNYYNLNVSKFLTGGTTDEEGNVTYSDEERAAAVTAAEEAAKSLVIDEIETVADLDAAIAALDVNAEVADAKSTTMTDIAYESVLSMLKDWVTDPDRKAGDKTYVENATTSTDADGNETKTVNGYYVVMFTGVEDNDFALKNVRHILVAFEGGTYDETTGITTYSTEEKYAAQLEAEELLAEWESGKATEDTFALLANEKSDDGDGTTGGLYTDIYPNQMVDNFENWCFEDGRQPGETGIIETEYGYHIMYFVGDSETSYRDYMIEADLRSTDTAEWYNNLIESNTVTEGEIKYIRTDLVLSGN